MPPPGSFQRPDRRCSGDTACILPGTCRRIRRNPFPATGKRRSGISESRPKAAPAKIYSYCSIGFFQIQSSIPVSNAVFAIDRGKITGGVCRNRGGKWGLLFYAGSAIMNSTMQGSYIGNTTASQAVKAGSIPVPCSTSLRTVHRPQRFFMRCRKNRPAHSAAAQIYRFVPQWIRDASRCVSCGQIPCPCLDSRGDSA